MLLLAAVSALLTLRRVSTAVKLYYHVYESDRIRSPFVLGLVKPRIYLPFGLAPRQREYVLCHETVHIRRKDYLIKPLGFLVLALHWFNPLVWLSFHLMSRDMEMSCDEKVLSQLGEEVRRDYSLSLLSIGMNRRFAFPDPLGFGETGVKERVRNVMKFHKAKTFCMSNEDTCEIFFPVFLLSFVFQFIHQPVIDTFKCKSSDFFFSLEADSTEQPDVFFIV